jgi:hypothetical protein
VRWSSDELYVGMKEAYAITRFQAYRGHDTAGAYARAIHVL